MMNPTGSDCWTSFSMPKPLSAFTWHAPHTTHEGRTLRQESTAIDVRVSSAITRDARGKWPHAAAKACFDSDSAERPKCRQTHF